MYPNLTLAEGVRLVVRESDVEAASALLTSQPSEPPSQNEAEPEAPSSSNLHVPLLLVLFVVALFCLLALGSGKHESETRSSFHYVNGKTDKEWIYRHGKLVEFLQDRNLDGAWDHWVHYDGSGEITESEYDNNFDGIPDETWTFSNDVLVRMEKDTDFNGKPDEFCTYKYRVIQQVDFRPNGSNFITQRWIYHNGVLAEILKGDEGNGKFRESVQYDSFFNPLRTNLSFFPLLAPSN
ncbi:MAG TPA: hypothetical protein VKA67_04055 [Verrucomicrobiae bacterium]|nr:hypothetical protein [Verrucomicrobiae bacterium]